MNVFERLHSGEAIDIRDEDYQREAHGEMDRCRQLCFEINSTAPKDREKIIELENGRSLGVWRQHIREAITYLTIANITLLYCGRLRKREQDRYRVLQLY